MKREDTELGIVVRFRNRTWSIVAIKVHIDGAVYADLLTSGDYVKDINVEKLEKHPLANECEDNTQKGKFFKSYDKEIAINGRNKESGKVNFVSLLKTEIEMFTESGEKVYMRIKKPTSQKE